MTALEIAAVRSSDLPAPLRRQLLELCSRAYQEDFVPYWRLLSSATHLLGLRDGEPVTHAAWVQRELRSPATGAMRTAYVEAVATLPEHQRRGFASQLLAHIPARLAEYDLAALSPSDEGFYARLGWEPWQGPLSYRDQSGAEVATPDESVMIYRLPLTPATLDLRASLSTDWRPIEVW